MYRFLVVWAAACNGKDATPPTVAGDDTDTDTDADTDTDVDTDADSDADTDPTGETGTAGTISDPYAGLDRVYCEGGFGNWITAWYVGDYVVSGNSFTGTETAALHFSDELATVCSYAPDCVITWTISGDLAGPVSCPTCDYSMAVHGAIDVAASDCPQERWEVIEPDEWDTVYDVKLLPDGTSQVSFAQSGNPFAAWEWTGDRVTYVSSLPKCVPYADDLGGVCP